MVLEMRFDLLHFGVLCCVCVGAFGSALLPLVATDEHSSIDTIQGAVHITVQGFLGVENWDQVDVNWQGEYQPRLHMTCIVYACAVFCWSIASVMLTVVCL